jgi:hypothetical protein
MTAAHPFALALALSGCAIGAPSSPVAAEGPALAVPDDAGDAVCPPVTVFGSMDRFRQGDRSQTVRLADLDWTATTIAVGATTDKAAEITAADGMLWLVAPGEGGVEVGHDAVGRGGSLVVTASPAAWDGGRPVDGATATSILAGVGASRVGTLCRDADAVPFIVRGHAEELTWSIVGQPSGTKGSEQDVDVVIVGFWAPGARGVYVPGSMDGHLHVVVPAKNVAGHLVSVHLEDGASLYLPASTD